MQSFKSKDHPHRRWNPLLEEWVLVSPHRAKRPWSGSIEKVPPHGLPEYDSGCYLCPGNTRAGGVVNPAYDSTFVFNNDFAALLTDTPHEGGRNDCNGLVREIPETGVCRVICFSPRHDLTMAEMELGDICRVIEVWRDQYQDLAEHGDITTVTLFENRGEIMGCSNPHPHGQLWANRCIPHLQAQELQAQANYFQTHRSPLLLDYLKWERERKTRIVVENDYFTALVPHWAIWPFEILIVPHRVVRSIPELSDAECHGWADIMKRLLVRYDNLFEVSFPYSMGIHQQPVDGENRPGTVMHQHYFPPLLRSATVRKFQVGYEMSSEPQRDITPEQAAERLRSLPDIHYKQRI